MHHCIDCITNRFRIGFERSRGIRGHAVALQEALEQSLAMARVKAVPLVK